MGYQNICVSATDLVAGPSFLKAIDYSGSVFLSANLLNKSNKPIFQPGRLYTIKGTRIGIIALTDTDKMSMISHKGEQVIAQEPVAALKKIWHYTKENADLIILLTSLNKTKIKNLLKIFPEVDLVISSGIEMPTYVPLKAGNTLIVSSHPKGKSVGLIAIEMKDGIISKYNNRLIMLKDSFLDTNY